MRETHVRLLCPECTKDWERHPDDLPDPDDVFDCPDCNASHRLAEFARTDRDLETLEQFG